MISCDSLGNYRGFQFIAAVFHLDKELRQIAQRNFVGDEDGGANIAARNQLESLANESWCVVKSGFDGDFGIVKLSGLQADFRTARAAAEHIDVAAFANHLESPFPGGNCSGCFDDPIGAAAAFSKAANVFGHIGNFGDVDQDSSPEAARYLALAFAAGQSDDFNVPRGEDADEFEADGAAADNYSGVAGAQIDFVCPAKDTSKRLGHGSITEWHVIGNFQKVLFDDPARDADVLGVGAIIEEQVFAKVRLPLLTEKAGAARRGIRRDDAHADLNAIANCFTLLGDNAGQLVAEERGRLDHAGVESGLPNFQIGAAGKRRFDFDQNVGIADGRHADGFNFKVLRTVEDGRRHGLGVRAHGHDGVYRVRMLSCWASAVVRRHLRFV